MSLCMLRNDCVVADPGRLPRGPDAVLLPAVLRLHLPCPAVATCAKPGHRHRQLSVVTSPFSTSMFEVTRLIEQNLRQDLQCLRACQWLSQ
eukprot:15213881-Alexandrium_andersonii.AAC.1